MNEWMYKEEALSQDFCTLDEWKHGCSLRWMNDPEGCLHHQQLNPIPKPGGISSFKFSFKKWNKKNANPKIVKKRSMGPLAKILHEINQYSMGLGISYATHDVAPKDLSLLLFFIFHLFCLFIYSYFFERVVLFTWGFQCLHFQELKSQFQCPHINIHTPKRNE